MKYTKKLSTAIGAAVLLSVSLNCMEPLKFTPKSFRPGVQVKFDHYNNDLTSVKTSDNVRMQLPQWQIDQMKLVEHKGRGTKYYWVDAPMVTSNELELVQKALNITSNLEQFRQFYNNLSQDKKETLINSASKLEMQSLTSLLIIYTFPIEVQQQMGASVLQNADIIRPVVDYLIGNDLQDNKKILRKDIGDVKYLACSSDGNYIVSGSDDNDLILWNGKTGEQIKILKGHTKWVQCVAYSPDGNYIVSGAGDKNLILWNGKTGEQIKILKGHTNWVLCVAYSPDGNYIVSGDHDNDLILWNGKTGEQIKILKGHTDRVMCVAYSPDGNYIVSGSNDEDLILWNGKTGEQIKILKGHTGWVGCVAYSPDGNYIVSGSGDKDLILWNGKTGEQIKILKGHTHSVECVAYSPDGNYIVSGSNDKDLILWNGKTGEQIKILKGHTGWVGCVAYSPDGNYIVSGSGDKDLILWNGKTGEQIKILKGHTNRVYCVAYSPHGDYIVSGAFAYDHLILWKLINKKALDFISTQLNFAQARLLYRLYVAKINHVPAVLDAEDIDYQVFKTLPVNVQDIVKVFLPFQSSSEFIEKQIQEKMNEYRLKFIKTEASRDDTIKVLKILMKDFAKDSIDYKACKQLLIELEMEKAFEG